MYEAKQELLATKYELVELHIREKQIIKYDKRDGCQQVSSMVYVNDFRLTNALKKLVIRWDWIQAHKFERIDPNDKIQTW